MSRKLAAIALSLGYLHAGSVMALGLGELKLESFLNEPLKAEVDLLNIGNLHPDEIRVRLATREDFEKMGLERAYFLTGIKFTVVTDGSNGPSIVITSDDPVLEPYLDFLVEARWPNGRLLREYTVLVDPPVFDTRNPVVSATERVYEVEGISPAPVKKTEPEAVSGASGTQVKVMESSLAPGEMPNRDFNAQTSETPLPGRRYMIHRDDTLWEIAQQARPGGVSVHQTMLDIQRLNPEAFINGNINRIKAGYIVYLPSADDISSEDLAAALAEVKQQNEDWRAGRATAPAVSSGPTLRISAEEPGISMEAQNRVEESASRETAASAAATAEESERIALENADSADRLEAVEHQVETLNRIITLKDEQIAALQAALAEMQAGGAGVPSTGPEGDMTSTEGVTLPEDSLNPAPENEAPVAEPAEAEVAEESVTALVSEEPPLPQEEAAPAPVAAPTAAPVSPAPEPDSESAGGGLLDYIWYLLGAVVLAALGFVFARRRGEKQDETDAVSSEPPAEDVFADVKLREPALKVEAPVEQPEVAPAESAQEPSVDQSDNRGYGERKHDEYASDVDAGDALAEADIYVAYGRYPQAIDLLVNALVNEPGNAAYRLKLLELYAETGDRDAARQQYAELQSLGDAANLERAEAVMADLGSDTSEDDARRFIQPLEASDPSEPPQEAPPIDLLAEDAPLEAEFSGLEIETPDSGESMPDELDLSADFADNELAQGDDEELVIAAESNGLSTKLDLARAYLDMGDEDGARQILEEVIAEGGDELKAEASALLERIG